MTASAAQTAAPKTARIQLAGRYVFMIDRVSLIAALSLLWALLVLPWFVVPQRFAIFGMDLIYGRSWIGGSNLPQRGLASIDRIIGQLLGGEIWLLPLAALISNRLRHRRHPAASLEQDLLVWRCARRPSLGWRIM